MVQNLSLREENGQSPRRRWEWLLLLLALLMSFGCVFCSTSWAIWWPDQLTPASLLAQQQANYRQNAADAVEFAVLDPLIIAQAATDVARLHLTPVGNNGSPADEPFAVALLPVTPSPTSQPEALPLPQASNTPGSVTTPATAVPSPVATANSTATAIPQVTATASSIPPTVTVPVATPTLPAVLTSTPLPTQTPVVASPTPPPPPTATSVPPTSPPATNPPKPTPTHTSSPTFTPTATPTVTATPTHTAIPTATPTDTVTPTPTPLPANSILASCETGINIDGDLSETDWNGPATVISKLVLGTTAPVTANYKVRWNTAQLYIGIDVADTAIYTDSGPISYWEDDAVEIFFDINNNHSTTYQSDDFQFIVGWTDPTQYFVQNLTDAYYNNGHSGVQFGLITTAAGYSAEIAIPWNVLGTTPNAGNVYGFDMGVDGDQDGGNREAQLMWQGTADNWQDTSAFGQLVLANCIP